MNDFLNKILNESPKENKLFAEHSLDIAFMLIRFLKEKNMKKQDFADLVGQQPSVVPKWLSGSHNFTLATLSLIEAKTGLSIVKLVSKKEIKDFNRSNETRIIPITGNPVQVESTTEVEEYAIYF